MVPPLPIPNREVKHSRADGTAHPRESRSPPFFTKSPEFTLNLGLFLFYFNTTFLRGGFVEFYINKAHNMRLCAKNNYLK